MSIQQFASPRFIVTILAGLQAFGPLSIDLILPALPIIGMEFSEGQQHVQRLVSAFLSGLFIGMLAYGPLSDKYGRRNLLLFGMVLYIGATLGCLFVEDINLLIAFRFLQALGGAAASVLGRIIVRDVFSIDEVAKILSLMHLVTMVAALAAPIVGGYLLGVTAWRTLFAMLLVYSSILLWLTFKYIPETHRERQLDRTMVQVFSSYWEIAKQPAGAGYVLCMALCFAGMFCFITVSSFIYMDFFKVTTVQFGWFFSLNLLGVIGLVALNARLLSVWGTQKLLWIAVASCLAGSVVLVILMLLDVLSVIGFALCVFCFVSCTGVVGANCTGSLMRLYPEKAGAATGQAVSAQFGCGALFSSIITLLHDGSPVALAWMLLLCSLGSAIALARTRTREPNVASA